MKNQAYQTPKNWQEYELIDSGDGKKLERFGQFTLIRPETAATWHPNLQEKDWFKMHQAQFLPTGHKGGKWETSEGRNFKKEWQLRYPLGKKQLTFMLQTTAFKHIGLFPEQAANWDYIHQQCTKIKNAKVLNLFAYTGGATLAAKAAGADVTHVDSIKQVVQWGSKNMKLSGLDHVRWVVEDAIKFVQREVKRGKKYHGIILDPPAYGLGKKGERWKLENSINELLSNISQLLESNQHFMVLNVYSNGLTPLSVKNFLYQHFPSSTQHEAMEMCLVDRFAKKLPLGVVGYASK
jgi:23S rRNA (cytosine1962-C5)-methyltransferase